MGITMILAASLAVTGMQPSQSPPPQRVPPSVDMPSQQEIVVRGTTVTPRSPNVLFTEELWLQNHLYWDIMDAVEFVPNDVAAMVEARFRQADSNHDGKLSREEMVAHDRLLGRQAILYPAGDLESLRANEMRDANPYRARMLNLDARMIKNGDMDGDEQLNRFEALVAALRQFKRLDKNSDMVVKGIELHLLKRRDAKALLPGDL